MRDKNGISIGMPVYNGEEFLVKKIKSILEQKFENFELIISDNHSTDLTEQICKEFQKKDKRVLYCRQEQNIGAVQNYILTLEKAKFDYFLWTAVDDVISSDFLEKNYKILLENQEIVCSASQVEYFGDSRKFWHDKSENSLLKFFIKKTVERFQNIQNIPANGEFSSKFRKYLKYRGHHHIFYGMYRTNQLRNIVKDFSSTKNKPNTIDLGIMLVALSYGDFHVINEILMHRYDGGMSSQGFFDFKKSQKLKFIEAISYNYPFSKWCIEKFGFKLFLKNVDLFVLWNIEPMFFFMVNILRCIIEKKNNIKGNKKVIT